MHARRNGRGITGDTRHLSRAANRRVLGNVRRFRSPRHSGQEFATRDRELILDTTGRERCVTRVDRSAGSVPLSSRAAWYDPKERNAWDVRKRWLGRTSKSPVSETSERGGTRLRVKARLRRDLARNLVLLYSI